MTAPQSLGGVPSGGRTLAQFLAPVSDDDAMIYAGMNLAAKVTIALEADYDEIWCIMTHLPDGYLRLLESPEGWSALSAIVAASLGISSVPVNPVIH